MASAWALVSESFMIISAILVAVGWRQVRLKRYSVHRKIMLAAATLGACFFVSYALDTLLVGDTLYGGPAKYANAYQIFLQIHVFLATTAGIMGVVTVVAAIRKHFVFHRRLAPWTAVMWFIAASTGLVVYLMLFVIFPSGPTYKDLLHVLFPSHG